MRISIVVVAYNIPRELPRTLYSLSTINQHGMAAEEYEVLVIDNGSFPAVNPEQYAHLGKNFRFLRIDNASPSPANAINVGIAEAKGEAIGVMIDGARMASPGLVGMAWHGVMLHPNGVTGALGWYLGYDFQRNAMETGYNQAVEDRLLDSVDWRKDGYELFTISTMDESSTDGWFAPIAELNAIFMHREKWARLGGMDNRFDLPGGGLVNLDLYARAVEEPEAALVLLVGEATFHQFHHGVATNSSAEKALIDWQTWEFQYASIRGKSYAVPIPRRQPVLLGAIPRQMRRQFARATVLPAPDRHTGEVHEGTGNPLEDLLLADAETTDSRLRHALQLVRQQLKLSRYASVTALCRQLRQHYPDHRPTLELLSLVAPWVPHAGRYNPSQADEVGVICQKMSRLLADSRFPSPAPSTSLVTLPSKELLEHSTRRAIYAGGPEPSEMEQPEFVAGSASIPQIESAFIEPLHMSHSAPWAGHIPFAAWLVDIQRPALFVELGSFLGISYLAFCQAIAAQKLDAKAFAVDTWQGDAHTGAYDEKVFQTIRRNHDPLYTGFSTLLRMRFDEARPQFADGSIDLLHIDGLHTYEAVRHDFETWLPKMSSRGIILFHDTEVRHGDFGVFRFWAEIRRSYPSFSFSHSNGLGILLVGPEQPATLTRFTQLSQSNDAEPEAALRLFTLLGARLERQAEVMVLEEHLREANERVEDLNKAGQRRHDWIVELDAALLEHGRKVSALDKALKEHQGLLADAEALLLQRTAYVAQLLNSRSWRVTAPLRWAIANGRKVRNALRYVQRGEWKALVQRFKIHKQESRVLRQLPVATLSERHVGILTTPHTLFFAYALSKALVRAGFTADILTQTPPGGYELGMYFVICPHAFRILPPGERRIAIQMEQAVNDRWFTAEYFSILENSFAVFDYAQFNLHALENKGLKYPHTYLVPVGGISAYRPILGDNEQPPSTTDPQFDVLFYGDASAPRRKRLLDVIRQQFKLRVESNLFGPELYRAIASAKVVVNLHYYEGALLESTRLYECLSLGATVVSEAGADQAEYHPLEDVIRFFPVGDERALLDSIRAAIDCAIDPLAAAEVVLASESRFQFMFFRALLGMHLIGAGKFGSLTADYCLPGPRLALSLPETTHRRSLYASNQPAGVAVFDGLRRAPGWVGCALSYQFLARKALEEKFEYLEVMEDDVLLPPDYEARRAAINAYLDANKGDWDIFAGLITVLHPLAKVLRVDVVDDLTLVTLDRLTGTVHNRYAPTALKMLSQWDSNNADASTNTIDKYLESQPSLRVVTTLPYLVGHREDAHSSLWGFENSQYSGMIANSEIEIRQLVTAFLGAVNEGTHGIASS